MSGVSYHDCGPALVIQRLKALSESSNSVDTRPVIKVGKKQRGNSNKGVSDDARNSRIQKSVLFRLYGESGDNLFVEKSFDNPAKSVSLEKPIVNDGIRSTDQAEFLFDEAFKFKSHSLTEIFQALLESAANTLRNDPSNANTRRVMFDVVNQTMKLIALKADMSDSNAQMAMLQMMEQSSQLVVKNMVIPQFNSRAPGIRVLVFNVYSRLAKLLGRNTEEAVRADFKAMLNSASEHITYNPGLGRSSKTSPVDHISNVIEPLLDDDFKLFAYDMNSYRVPSIMKFYNLLGTWRSRNKEI